ncbi:Short-chain dehydrogenase/reductase family protein [Mycena chlorophos]|uniref:Short-chain dehydrogenase/reductase family protein n=1 Tax=Mycena chlorophos TaxID=658473 RepID=A0A8H6SKE2_MYCCL|nr:Short-chain dehydrogenase/reductase family protein [Mycena chlorophos]
MSTLPTFTKETTSDEIVDTFSETIKGKNVLITGTSLNGLGFETARATAKYASLVVITGYNEERLQASQDAILMAVPGANVRTLVLDLSSLAAVRKAAAEVNAYEEPLHVLINNAAATSGVYKLTPDNFEIQMGAGHIGPFLFTKLLLPKILSSASSTYTPRVVFVSSIGHMRNNGAPVEDKEEFLRGHGGPKDADPQETPLVRYGEVKSANVLTAKELARRGKGKLLAYSLHPGAIWTNAFTKEMLQPEFKAVGLVVDGRPNPNLPGGWKSLSQGAGTILVAAFDTRITNQSGAYLDDCVVAEDHVAPHSADMTRAAKLWEVTEEAIGEKFDV